MSWISDKTIKEQAMLIDKLKDKIKHKNLQIRKLKKILKKKDWGSK